MDDPTKFENIVGGITFGEFGCPESVNGLKFPGNMQDPPSKNVKDAVWTNDVNVAITDNSLSKDSEERGWNAGATSADSITSGNGYVETTIDETNTWRMIGLSKGDNSQHRDDIDFAAYFYGDGSLRVWENGQTVAIVGSYESGDVIRVEIDGSNVLYQKNGIVVFTSKDVITESSYPLLVDTSLASPHATLKDVKIGIMKETPDY